MRERVLRRSHADSREAAAQELVTAAGGHGTPGPLTVESAPSSAGGGPPAEALLQHFVFHAPPRRQFLMPLLSTDAAARSRNQVQPPCLLMRLVPPMPQPLERTCRDMNMPARAEQTSASCRRESMNEHRAADMDGRSRVRIRSSVILTLALAWFDIL